VTTALAQARGVLGRFRMFGVAASAGTGLACAPRAGGRPLPRVALRLGEGARG
jgi:hypothetical protein